MKYIAAGNNGTLVIYDWHGVLPFTIYTSK
jgi:hypothetical protein